ncbi:MAG TPA: FAD-dependent oxidoreductase [Burkholderiaceae bacterium]|nr:FAD-dependent oxidoreductase [Burkholderiaceae bacterium]
MTEMIIVGAGLAGLRAAEAARKADPLARITLVGDEPMAPYSRPPLSKAFLQDRWDFDRLLVRPMPWFDAANIALLTGRAVTHIDREAGQVVLQQGRPLAYDKLVLATGSRPRRLVGPDIDHGCVQVLRTAQDAQAIRAELARAASLVVVGGGVIGLELASSARAMGVQVTVLEAGARLMGRSVPMEISDWIGQLHGRHGVDVLYGIQITSIQRCDNALRVVTNAGVFMADCVVAGVGVTPNTELATAAGLRVEDGIVVDESGRTEDANVFAAGEVTRHFNPALNECVRVESWQIADRQAAAAGSTAAGKPLVFDEIPWFWSDQYQTNLQVLGSFQRVTQVWRRPGASANSFTLLGLDGGERLVGAVCVDSGREMSVLKRILATRSPLDSAAVSDPAMPLRDILAACQAMATP